MKAQPELKTNLGKSEAVSWMKFRFSIGFCFIFMLMLSLLCYTLNNLEISYAEESHKSCDFY